MIELTDTHCHIQSINQSGVEEHTAQLWQKLGKTDIETVIRDASEAGVTRLIAVGTDLDDSKLAIETAQAYQNVWASIGIHPHEAKKYAKDRAKQEEFASLTKSDKVVAVGECGLDYFYNHSGPKDQKAVLDFQLSLASKHNLPVIFHVREAYTDFWPMLDNYPNIRGVLHSFTDSLVNLTEALNRGLFIGVNGISTFTRDPVQLAMFKQIPLPNLLLETDSPYLTPAPKRGNINQPKYVRLVAENLERLRGQSLEIIASQTTKNARQLFHV
jgi:TatD DNase family protein